MTQRRSKQSRLKYLKQKFRLCWYCKCELVYYPLKKGEKVPPNYATIEHLNSRLQYPNGRPPVYGKSRSLVVACLKCNNERAELEQAALPKEELWRRSGRKPLALVNV